MSPRPAVRLTALLATLIMVVAACDSGSPSESPSGSAQPSGETPTGGTVRIGIGGSPDSLNPGNGLLTESYELYELMYDTPIAVAPSGEFVPELATDWSVGDDGVTWTLTLVDDATFHDGTPLTSADVKFSLDLYRDTVDFPYLSLYPDVFESVEAPDETTVVITASDTVGNFESRMAFMYILPMHIWEAEADDPVAFKNAEMIGSGPFKLVEYDQNEFIRLEANAAYWNGPPLVDEVILQTYTNPDARIAALVNGDVDAITEFPATAVSTLQQTDNIEVLITDVAAGGSLRDVFFNMLDPDNCPTDDPETAADDSGICSGHEALRDVVVRQAMALAVDKQQLIDVATLGTGTRGVSLVPPGLGDYFIGADADRAFDPDAANAALDEAGYADTNGDGVRECASGQGCADLTFRFAYPNDIDTAPREAEMLAAMWEEIGVAIEITALDPDALTAICCPLFDYDVILWGWGSDPDPSFLLDVATCDDVSTGFNETGYCNPEYDELFAAQGVEIDRAARVEMVHQMQEILLEDVPYIIPYYDGNIEAFRTDTFAGWHEGPASFGLSDPSSLLFVHPVE